MDKDINANIDKDIMRVDIPVSSIPCEVRIYVDEQGRVTIRKIYEKRKE